MAKWIRYYRIAYRSHELEAIPAQGDERYGYWGQLIAKTGQWVCRSVENNHMWICSDGDFHKLYCEIGKSPKNKYKKDTSSIRKKSKKRQSSSAEIDDVFFGDLFEEINEF